MEPNLIQPNNPLQQMPQEQPSAATPQTQPMFDPSMLATLQQNRRGSFLACLFGLIPLILIFVFLFFGGKIFGFFHIQNIYNFIISIIILTILYIIALGVSSAFVKKPRDLLSIIIDRLRE